MGICRDFTYPRTRCFPDSNPVFVLKSRGFRIWHSLRRPVGEYAGVYNGEFAAASREEQSAWTSNSTANMSRAATSRRPSPAWSAASRRGGKTFTAAKVIALTQRPTLVLAHNKTLAAQLYHEFRHFFPQNAVEYFVSYYDYYQPEAYLPSSDTYIEKEAPINDELDKLRMSATRSLFERRDVIIVASVSCIYGIGSPEAYYGMLITLEKGQHTSREALLRRLVDIQYERSEDLRRGPFRCRGDMIEIYPPYQDDGFRFEMWGEEIDAIRRIDPLTGEIRSREDEITRVPIYPKTH